MKKRKKWYWLVSTDREDDYWFLYVWKGRKCKTYRGLGSDVFDKDKRERISRNTIDEILISQ